MQLAGGNTLPEHYVVSVPLAGVVERGAHADGATSRRHALHGLRQSRIHVKRFPVEIICLVL